MRLLAWLALVLALAGCATIRETGPGEGNRVVRELGDGWQFRFDDSWDLADAMSARDQEMERVSIPHSWTRLGEQGLVRTDATDDRRGRGWYRLAIDGRSLDPSRRHFIEFDAVGNVADAWLNGRHLGQHAGAFSRFRFELTPALDLRGANLLVVRADNSEPKPGSTTEHVVPLLGDFFIHGGIYRPVRLVSVAPSHFSLADHGGPGIYADIGPVTPDRAQLSVRARLAGARPGQMVEVQLVEADGRLAASARRELGQGDVTETRIELALDRPRLWEGRRDPYRYRLAAILLEDGRPLDRVEQWVGIRSFRFDANEGFFLNGRHLPLHGVSRHQDMAGKGWALEPADHERDMALIAEMGANTVRFAHYQHAGQWFDLADRYGMLVWAEIPFVNKLSFGDVGASPQLVANARQQLVELIRQNYNHPSVVTWGIGNEVDIDLAFNRLGPKADPRPLLRELNALSHAEDHSRPTVIADCCEATPGDKVDYLAPLTGEADLMGYNRYYGWYYGKVSDLGPHLDALHARYPDVPLSVSEYGAGGALTQHVADPEHHRINAGGRPHPEEYQSWIHEQSWPQLRSRRYLFANWIWNMFDFSSRRKEGDSVDLNDKGLVSFDRKTRKDAFFYYKAQWSQEPVVHITSRRFIERTSASTEVKVYSNAQRISLFLNGAALGDIPCVDRICRLDKVTLRPGHNQVEAVGSFSAGPVRDVVEWRLVPEKAGGLTSPVPASRR